MLCKKPNLEGCGKKKAPLMSDEISADGAVQSDQQAGVLWQCDLCGLFHPQDMESASVLA